MSFSFKCIDVCQVPSINKLIVFPFEAHTFNYECNLGSLSDIP